MNVLKKEKFIASFSATHSPAYTVELNETFCVETFDCYGGAITSEKQLRKEVQIDHLNPATGPIYINGLKEKETLCVEIIKIETEAFGVMVLYPGMGPLGKHVDVMDTRILPVRDGKVIFRDDLQIEANPMIGVIGTAPKIGEVKCESPGDHGGNLDTKYITAGSKVYLPVFHDGGLLALGDLHAAMGDGELNGSGVEIGGRVTMKATSFQQEISMPIVETDTAYMIVASDETLDQAIEKGLETAVFTIQKQLSLSYNDAYRLLSAVCDLQISQIVNPLVTVRVSIPKSLLKQPLFTS
ncbi:acetamidase/formamidase family protein [Bacillus chungangensis]|uniref:Amidase n=1 Tax=Bacillus chungangensis TaxID=587633 RepID=A0ABT9WT23_9BACI|nr:acetamidase/formamidase family protein [Bacillus chungangensis]MDQ0176341.1 amidase [Bacillus chungangensis]